VERTGEEGKTTNGCGSEEKRMEKKKVRARERDTKGKKEGDERDVDRRVTEMSSGKRWTNGN